MKNVISSFLDGARKEAKEPLAKFNARDESRSLMPVDGAHRAIKSPVIHRFPIRTILLNFAPTHFKTTNGFTFEAKNIYSLSGKLFSILLFSSITLNAQKYSTLSRESFQFFPESSFVSIFTADAHAHRTEVENILVTKNIRASMGTMIPILNFNLFNKMMQASLGGSVHFELHPIGQAQIVSNEYYIDFLTLDIPLREHLYARWVTGHTSHHFSDNWYERLKLSSSVRYSRDYTKLYVVYEQNRNSQLYCGADYAYSFTIIGRIEKPWIFQTGGIAELEEFGSTVLFTAADCKIHQEAGFAVTSTLQLGVMIPMRFTSVARLSLQYRTGLDERGQFFPQHRSFTALAIAFE